jgi:8-oxo-dGTP pyrophosphatase MutT (NUDIX family)
VINAAGCIFLASDTNRICLQLRGVHSSHAHTWGFWGGKSEHGERPVETLLRELNEEIGMLPDIQKMHPLSKYVSADGNFEYDMFVVVVYDEFIPRLNKESAGYAWVDVGMFPQPLHKGAQSVFSDCDIIQKLNTIISTLPVSNYQPNWLDSVKTLRTN